jgi:tetratricopeptide (TPR) repeat protein
MPPTPTEKNKSFKFVLVAAAVIVVASVAAAYYYFVLRFPPDRYTNEHGVFSVLVEENPVFAEADRLMRARSFDEAYAKYQEALSLAADPFQEAYIKYSIASVQEARGNYLEAVRGFKEVVAAPNSFHLIRGYAVMRIGLLPNLSRIEGERASIIAETFKGDPYASFFAEGDEALAYSRLHEYAVSFYPVPVSELIIANWHLNRITALQQRGVTGEEAYAPHLETAVQRTRTAKVNLESSLQNQNAAAFASTGFSLLGRIYSKFIDISRQPNAPFDSSLLEQEGIGLEAAEEALAKALTLAPPAPANGYERFYYASFLYGWYPEREKEIRALLAAFYEDSSYQGTGIMKFFEKKQGTGAWENRRMIELATLDEGFKQLLLSLGWSAEDFVESSEA